MNIPWWLWIFAYPMSMTAAKGSHTMLFAATSAEVAAARDKYKAAYLEPIAKLTPLTPEAKDSKLAKTLWDTSETVVHDVLSQTPID